MLKVFVSQEMMSIAGLAVTNCLPTPIFPEELPLSSPNCHFLASSVVSSPQQETRKRFAFQVLF